MLATYAIIGIIYLTIAGWLPEVIKEFRLWRKER